MAAQDAVLANLGDVNDESVVAGLREPIPPPVAVHPIKDVGDDLCYLRDATYAETRRPLAAEEE